jgi:hypothetical protein
MSLTLTSRLITDAMQRLWHQMYLPRREMIFKVEYVSEQLDLKGAAPKAFSNVFALNPPPLFIDAQFVFV